MDHCIITNANKTRFYAGIVSGDIITTTNIEEAHVFHAHSDVPAEMVAQPVLETLIEVYGPTPALSIEEVTPKYALTVPSRSTMRVVRQLVYEGEAQHIKSTLVHGTVPYDGVVEMGNLRVESMIIDYGGLTDWEIRKTPRRTTQPHMEQNDHWFKEFTEQRHLLNRLAVLLQRTMVYVGNERKRGNTTAGELLTQVSDLLKQVNKPADQSEASNEPGE